MSGETGTDRLSRRKFVGLAGGAVAAGVALGGSPLGALLRPSAADASTCTGYVPRPMVGTISWTCNATVEGSAELWLEEMATIGYTYVEHAGGVIGYGSAGDSGLDGSSPRLGMTAKQFKAALDKAGV